MRREGVFLQCDHTGEKKARLEPKLKKETQKTKKDSTFKKNLREKKKCSFVEIWVLRKTPQTGSFFGRKKSESHPSFFISKKKKNFENEKS